MAGNQNGRTAVSEQRSELFEQALSAFREGFFERAATLFSVLAEEGDEPVIGSYLGASLVLSDRDAARGMTLCRESARRMFQNAEVHENLARAYLHRGEKTRAIASLRNALRADPTSERARNEIEKLGLRRRPPFPTLGRNHPLNRAVGRLTWWLGFRTGADPLEAAGES